MDQTKQSFFWVEYSKNKQLKQHNDWMHKCLPRDAIHSVVCCRAVSVCPSVCHVDVSKRPNLLSNFFIAWWPHHSSFSNIVKFRRGHPQQWRQIKVGYQKLAIFNQYFRNTDTDTEYRGISKYRYRIPNRHEKIPTKIPNTDTNSKYRYRPSIPCSNFCYVMELYPV